MNYVIYIHLDIGEIRLQFETDEILYSELDVLQTAYNELKESKFIDVSALQAEDITFEIVSGEVIEN